MNAFELQLKINIFPKIEGFTDDEIKHMLIYQTFDTGNGLSIFQTTPNLAQQAIILKYNELSKLHHPMLEPAMTNFQLPAKIVCLLNNTLGSDQVTNMQSEELNYAMTFLFIYNDSFDSYKLAKVYFGDAVQNTGKWASAEQTELLARALNVPFYQKDNNDVNTKGNIEKVEK